MWSHQLNFLHPCLHLLCIPWRAAICCQSPIQSHKLPPRYTPANLSGRNGQFQPSLPILLQANSRKRGQGWCIRERDARDAAHSDPLGLPQVPTLASCRGLEPRRGHRDIETPIQSKTLTLSLDVKPTRACGPDQPITAVWYSATFQAQGSAWSDRAIADTTGHGVAATAHPISTRPSP